MVSQQTRCPLRLRYAIALVLGLVCNCSSDDERRVQLDARQQPSLELPESLEILLPLDIDPPQFQGLTSIQCLGWGRLQLSWSAASDELSDSQNIRYRLTGSRPHSMLSGRPPSSPPPSVEYDMQPGQLSATLTVPLDATWWSAVAIDEAGNLSPPSRPIEVFTRPRLMDLLNSSPEGALFECLPTPSGEVLCAGRDARLSLWDGSGWRETRLAVPEFRLLSDLRGSLRILTTLEQLLWHSPDEIEPLPVQFERPPSFPPRRLSFEPSGLALLTDRIGRVWASEDTSFRQMHNPLLLTSTHRCRSLIDLVFSGERGFAWCANRRQYLLRTSGANYQWMELPDADTLTAPPVAQRQLLFGEGRQISLLTWDGQLWRYDMGGWSQIRPEISDQPVSSMVYEQDNQTLLFAVGCQLMRLTAFGSSEQVAELPCRAPIVYLDTAGRLAISEIGEVFRWAPVERIHGPLKPGFSLTVRQQTQVVGVFSPRPAPGIYRSGDDGWSFSALPSIPADFVLHEAILRADGSAFLAGQGASSGRILRAEGNRWVEAAFLYPLPPVELPELPEGAPEEQNQPLPEEPLELSQLLPSGPASALPEPPPNPPAVRAIVSDDELSTSVAAGEAGSLWLELENSGWRWIDSGTTAQLDSLAILGRHHFVVGGVEGLVIECHLDQCRREVLPIGNVRGFLVSANGLLVYGSLGMAQRLDEAAEWSPLALEFSEPYPAESQPSELVALDESNGRRWLLTEDGTIWLLHEGHFIAMGMVEDPLDLWVLDNGMAAVVLADQILSFDLPLSEL